MAQITKFLTAVLAAVGISSGVTANSPLNLIIGADDVGGNGASNSVPDSFRVIRKGVSLNVYVNDSLSRSVDFTSLGSITVSGSADDDTLTVDFAGGNPIPRGGLVYHGRENVTKKGDTLKLEHGTVGTVSYRFFNPTDGALEVDGQLITYTGIEPVFDNVPSSLTVNGTNARNSITYRQGSDATRGLIAVDDNETIEFQNKTSVTINGLDGDDDVVLNNPNTPTGLTSIVVEGGNGNDTVSVYASGTPLTLYGNDGDDHFRIEPSVSALYTLDGGGQVIGDLLVVDTTSGGKFVDTGSAVRIGGVDVVDYTGIERVVLMGPLKRSDFLLLKAPF